MIILLLDLAPFLLLAGWFWVKINKSKTEYARLQQLSQGQQELIINLKNKVIGVGEVDDSIIDTSSASTTWALGAEYIYPAQKNQTTSPQKPTFPENTKAPTNMPSVAEWFKSVREIMPNAYTDHCRGSYVPPPNALPPPPPTKFPCSEQYLSHDSSPMPRCKPPRSRMNPEPALGSKPPPPPAPPPVRRIAEGVAILQ